MSTSDQSPQTQVVSLGSFDRLVATHERGDLNDTLSKALVDAVAAIEDHYNEFRGTPSATLSVKFKLTKEEDIIAVVATVDKKLPARPRAKRVYYATPDNKLTPNNPRQIEMNLRDVTAPAGQVRTL